MNSNIYSGLRWLLDSGIQAEDGGVYRGLRAPENEPARISTEATAWYVLALLRVGEPEGVQLERAEKAGRYLMERARDVTTDLFSEQSEEAGRRVAEFLSSGLVLRALLALAKATGDNTYLTSAQGCARAMQNRMSRVDGSFFAQYDIGMQSPMMEVEGGADQLKVAACFMDLAEEGFHEFEYPAQLLTRWALDRCESWDPSLASPENRAQEMNSYGLFLEGLLPTAALDMRTGQALQTGLIRLETAILEANGSSTPEGLARLLRLRLYLDAFGMMELDYGRAKAEAEELASRQMSSIDPRFDGAFTVKPLEDTDRELRPEATAVAVQALEMWDEVDDGGFREHWRALI
ncbi:MAG: hypothetical protein R2748_01795 [Bryobacterales bacterium]